MNILMWNLAQMSRTVLPTYGKKKNSVSKIPGSLNLKFTFQFDHSSMLKNTSNKREIIVDADTNEGRDIPRYDAWKLARVVAWACVKHRVEASPCFIFEQSFFFNLKLQSFWNFAVRNFKSHASNTESSDETFDGFDKLLSKPIMSTEVCWF